MTFRQKDINVKIEFEENESLERLKDTIFDLIEEKNLTYGEAFSLATNILIIIAEEAFHQIEIVPYLVACAIEANKQQ